MLVIIYWSIVLINIIAFLSGKNIKFVSIPSAVFLMLFVMGKRYNGISRIGADYYNYDYHYEHLDDYDTIEIGYKFINAIGNHFSLPFEVFYMIVVASIVLLLLISVIKLSGNVHLFLISYLIYFDMVTIDLIRNQCAIAIIMVLVFSSLYKHRNFVPGLVVASSFHISYTLYFLPFYLTKKKNKIFAKKWLKFSMIILICFAALGSISIIKPIIIFFISMFPGGGEKYEGYLETNARFSFLLPVTIYFIMLLGIRYWQRNCIEKYKDEKKRFYADYLYRFSLFCSMFLVFTLLNLHLYRYVRDVTLIGIIFMGINSSDMFSNFQKRCVLLSYVLAISIGWFFFDVIAKGYLVDYVTDFYINVILN